MPVDSAHDPAASAPRRVDLHCHSRFSNKPAEAMLGFIGCPECYSEPLEVYAQARRRGMDFVTLTDHDSIDGAASIASMENTIIGEELTCWFPEDGCKMHLLVWGITAEDHGRLQSRAGDIYQVAEYLARNSIAHAVAHPIYRQNDRLERWHVERLLLLFRGFELLNGAHSPQHRQAFEPLLQWLNRETIEKLSQRHSLAPLWPTPWIKARTGGSDDHGLLNVGRTWTEFGPDADTPAKILQCLRDGTCRPGGESGSSAKLAHTFYSVGVRYYSRHVHPADQPPNIATAVLQSIVGERPAPSRFKLAAASVKSRLRRITQAILRPWRGKAPERSADSASILKRLFLQSFRRHLDDHPQLKEALDAGLPPLGEHEAMSSLIRAMNRDVTRGLADAVRQSVGEASFTGLFDSIAAILAQQFLLLPYYFALFHQNKERRHLGALTGKLPPPDASTLRVGLFTDTFDDMNGVGRFLRDMGEQSRLLGRSLVIHTCSAAPRHQAAHRRNFTPLLSMPLPGYPQLRLTLPPVLEVLEWADQQQFDAIHISTPGPMGLCGLAASWMLRAPVLGTYHTDLPAYAERLLGDHRIVAGTRAWCGWFYGQLRRVFARSRAYELTLRDLGIGEDRSEALAPGVDTSRFSPARRDPDLWNTLCIAQPLRLLYCGRLSREKNLDLLASIFTRLHGLRRDTALVFAGTGPHEALLRARLEGLPAYFLGPQEDEQLAGLYASADLLVFPSATDTLGQVVLEAQASGLPAIVSSIGGPRELIDHPATGLIVPSLDEAAWTGAIAQLLDSPATRARMSKAARQRAMRFSHEHTFGQFWRAHLRAASPSPETAGTETSEPAEVR